MDFFDFLTMLGGLALFLYGMQLMSQGLTGFAGEHMREVLLRMTEGRWRSLLAGTVVTAVLQSSSAVTVMVVGFVNSGILKLEQAMGIIMGANIGTTLTSWLFAGNRPGNEGTLARLFQPTSLASVFALAGVVLFMTLKKETGRQGACALMGFSILAFGMNTMGEAARPLAGSEKFMRLLTGFEDPVRGVLGGCIMTAAIQSSSASVGILQILCQGGDMSYGVVLPIILGQNIGTCITAILAAMGTAYEAKQAAYLNLYYNLIGTVAFLFLFYLIHAIYPFAFLDRPASGSGIAWIHSGFNMLSAVVLLPFSGGIIRLTQLTIHPGSDRNI